MNLVLFPVFPSSTNGFHGWFRLVVWDSIPLIFPIPSIFGDLRGIKKPQAPNHPWRPISWNIQPKRKKKQKLVVGSSPPIWKICNMIVKLDHVPKKGMNINTKYFELPHCQDSGVPKFWVAPQFLWGKKIPRHPWRPATRSSTLQVLAEFMHYDVGSSETAAGGTGEMNLDDFFLGGKTHFCDILGWWVRWWFEKRVVNYNRMLMISICRMLIF